MACRIPINMGRRSMNGARWNPVGEFIFVGCDEDEFKRNPAKERRKVVNASVITMGFNVSGVPTWNTQQVIEAFSDIRSKQLQQRVKKGTIKETRFGGPPPAAASFIAQEGLFRDPRGGGDLEKDVEHGVQIAVINDIGQPLKSFRKDIEDVADELIETFDQYEVYVEHQKNGIIQWFVIMGPKGK